MSLQLSSHNRTYTWYHTNRVTILLKDVPIRAVSAGGSLASCRGEIYYLRNTKKLLILPYFFFLIVIVMYYLMPTPKAFNIFLFFFLIIGFENTINPHRLLVQDFNVCIIMA
jgi:hypothetical protein